MTTTVNTATGAAQTMVLNMGPQHPSTHGVLRVVLELEGETIVRARPEIGYLHTGIEKSCEAKTYSQVITLTDRLDYLAPLSNNLCYCLAVEKLLGLEVPKRAQYIRVLLTELTRIGSHLVWLGTHAIDLGAMSVLLYCFRGWLKAVERFIAMFPGRVQEYEDLLTQNRIWRARTRGIGMLSAADAIAMGVSGPTLRASGVAYDVRKSFPYSSYEEFEFDVPTRTESDCYARYLLRVAEMRESLKIIRQAMTKIPAEGPIRTEAPGIVPPDREKMKTEMEALIYHFKIFTEGFSPPPGEVYQTIESPRGELGFYVASDGSPRPWRVKVRAPSFVNLQALPCLVEGRLIADVVACIGTIDIVLGEVDR